MWHLRLRKLGLFSMEKAQRDLINVFKWEGTNKRKPGSSEWWLVTRQSHRYNLNTRNSIWSQENTFFFHCKNGQFWMMPWFCNQGLTFFHFSIELVQLLHLICLTAGSNTQLSLSQKLKYMTPPNIQVLHTSYLMILLCTFISICISETTEK